MMKASSRGPGVKERSGGLEKLRWMMAIPLFLFGWLMMFLGDKVVNMATWVSPSHRPPPPSPLHLHVGPNGQSQDGVRNQDVVEFWALD